VEDFAYSLSAAFKPHNIKSKLSIIHEDDDILMEVEPSTNESYISFGSKNPQESLINTPLPGEDSQGSQNAFVVMSSILRSWESQFVDAALSGTDGVPSLVPELFGVVVICYLIAISLLSPKKQKKAKNTDVTLSTNWKGSNRDQEDKNASVNGLITVYSLVKSTPSKVNDSEQFSSSDTYLSNGDNSTERKQENEFIMAKKKNK